MKGDRGPSVVPRLRDYGGLKGLRGWSAAVAEPMDKDHPNADVRPVKDEINPEGASFDLLFGVRRALVVIVVFHR